MRLRVDIKRMVLPERSMSRRERIALGEQIGRELGRLLQHGASPAEQRHQHSAPSVATQVAAAIAAQLPRQTNGRSTGRRS